MLHAHADILNDAYTSLGLRPVPQEGSLGAPSTPHLGTPGMIAGQSNNVGVDVHAASAWVRCVSPQQPAGAPSAPVLAPSVDVPQPDTALHALLKLGWDIAHASDTEALCVHDRGGVALTLRQGAASVPYISEVFMHAPSGQTAHAQTQLEAAGMHVLFHSHSLRLPSGTTRVPCVHLGCSTAPHAPSITLILNEEQCATANTLHIESVQLDHVQAVDWAKAQQGPLGIRLTGAESSDR